MRLKVWKRDTDGKSVSSSLSNFWSPFEMKGRQRKRESGGVRVCWRQDLHPAFRAPSLHSRKRDHKHPTLSLGDPRVRRKRPQTHLFWNSPLTTDLSYCYSSTGARTAGKTAGHPWAGESRHRIEELFRALNSGTEGCGGDWGLSWSSDWVQMVQGGLCVCCRGGCGGWRGWSEASYE